jgi:hypothetical protein
MPGSSSWMLYAPQGVKGLDDDENLPIIELFGVSTRGPALHSSLLLSGYQQHSCLGVRFATHLYLKVRLKTSGAISPLPIYFHGVNRDNIFSLFHRAF